MVRAPEIVPLPMVSRMRWFLRLKALSADDLKVTFSAAKVPVPMPRSKALESVPSLPKVRFLASTERPVPLVIF